LSHHNVAIRDAEIRDLPLILEFIRMKASFDGVPDSVEATEHLLRENLFSQRPLAFVALGELDGCVVGFASYFLTFSSFIGRPGIWLDDLFVEDSARGKGVGAALLTHLALLADARGYRRIEWLTATDNAQGLAFYARNGARVHEDVRLLRLESAEVSRLVSEAPIDSRFRDR
jgi:GNAT superfamily N-acetyltransferase